MVVDDFERGESRLAVWPGAPESRARAAPLANKALGVKRVAVYLVNFADDRSRPHDVEAVRRRVFLDEDSTDAFLRLQSGGRLDLEGDVHDYFEIAAARDPCDPNVWVEQVNALAVERGIDVASYDYNIYLHNDAPCDYGGVGELGGKTLLLQGYALGAAAHELGHNFGLLHANAFVCTGPDGVGLVPLSGACRSLEYGDQFSMMGGGTTAHQVNGWEKVLLGWFAPEDITAVTESGTYHIEPSNQGDRGPRGLRIARMVGCVTREYFVEFRPDAAFDLPASGGLHVRIAPEPRAYRQSHLLDMTPETSGGATDNELEHGFSDAPLPVGASYVDAELGLTITLVASSPEGGADVAVELAGGAPAALGEGRDPVLEYFSDFELGVPVASTTEESRVDFDFGLEAPREDVPADFSMRYSAMLTPARDATYRFTTVSDDGARLFVDDVAVIDQWVVQGATPASGDVALEGGHEYRVRFEHFDSGGEAMARLGWQEVDGADDCQVVDFSLRTGGGDDPADDPGAGDGGGGDLVGGCSAGGGRGAANGLADALGLLLQAAVARRLRARSSGRSRCRGGGGCRGPGSSGRA